MTSVVFEKVKPVSMYGKEQLNGKEIVLLMAEMVGRVVFFSLFFYRSLWAVFPLLPIGFYMAKIQIRNRKRKRQQLLKVQFKDAIMGISANLRAGYAIENAFRESLHEMDQLYGKDSEIYKALYVIVQGLTNNISIEQLLNNFAQETELEEIREFADVFGIARRKGGNLTDIIGETAAVIGEKIEVNREIQITLAAKQLEQKVMNVIPFGIVLYMMLMSKGYFDVLYHSVFGIGIMTACMVLYFAGYFWGQKIVDIQI